MTSSDDGPFDEPDISPDAGYAEQIEDLFPEVAATYRRLCQDPRLNPVVAALKERGMDDRDIESLFRRIANLPRDWQTDHEPLKQRRKRRSRLAKKLRELAQEVEQDPDLSGLAFRAGTSVYGDPGTVRHEMTVSTILNYAADFVTDSDRPLMESEDGPITPAEAEELSAPDRKISMKRYVLLEIFEMLERSFKTPDTSRAPNKETELLGAVVLDEDIPHGTVTQLRKNERRPYYKEPE